VSKWRALIVLGIALYTLSPLFGVEDPYSLPVSTVILDAGHGGHDPGASTAWAFAGGTVYERDLTLDITKRVYSLLAVSKPELHLILTRNDDTFLSLEQRSRIAYSTELPPKTSALFVSIHINSAPSKEASGFEILTKKQDKRVVLLNKDTPLMNIGTLSSQSFLELNRDLNHRNLVVAKTFEEVFSEKLPTSRNRGVKEMDLYVLNASRIPAVLVEVGFITNEEDARKLVSPQWRQVVAQAISEAVIRCL